MHSMTLEILIGLVTATWLLVCMYFYRTWRAALWLAGSTVAGALFFTGAAMTCSLKVPGSHYLAPLWAGMVAVLLLHLRAALRIDEPVDDGGQATVAECRVPVREEFFI